MSWSSGRALALVLAVFVAVGLSLYAVEASDMAVKMGTMSGMDMSGGDDCGGCPNKAPDGKGVACPSVCVAPLAALAPQVPSARIAISLPRLPPPRDPVLHGLYTPPDPYPPRYSGLA